ncbi:response regulator transcription factor [Neomegalonema sp.]|uniref:response regulator transcription factor n=1 Tax=Neomegalonema sp. TaxID=2039713 RepID=UPI0026024166|nr:response regulator transcription factor [Neomegalonema sp.]MDD2869235.1 response regulator transcription factor [Neomegalonema sp.]
MNAGPRILVAEDDPALREGLRDLLEMEGFSCRLAADGAEAWAAFAEEAFPLVVLDVVMPGRDGLSLCREIRRAAPLTQILMLSARGESFDKALGLEFGADDYMAKPFDPAELRARVGAMARRAACAPAPEEAAFLMDDLRIDPAAFVAIREGRRIELTRRELALLRLLHRHEGRPVDRDALLDEGWGRDHLPNSRALDQYISALRAKVEREPQAPRIIRTARGLGYLYLRPRDGE